MIKIDWTIWLQFANFFVLMIALNFLLYRPLRAVMAKRQETIDGARQKAAELDEQISEKMANYEQRLQEAKSKATQEKAEMRKAALASESETLQKASKEAMGYLDGIKAQVAAEADKARKVLKDDAEKLANEIATKVLGRGF